MHDKTFLSRSIPTVRILSQPQGSNLFDLKAKYAEVVSEPQAMSLLR
jgi:hypothetical protein